MANNNEEARIPVYINDEQAKSALKNLQNEADKWNKKMAEAASIGDIAGMKEAQKEMNKFGRQIEKVKREAFDVNKILNNLSSASTKELRQATAALNKEMDGLGHNTKAYADLQKKLQLVRTETHGVNSAIREQRGIITRVAEGVNKYWSIIGAGIMVVSGIINKMNQAVAATNAFEAKLANLSAITGLTGNSLEWLGNKAKEMSTATLEGGIHITKSADDIVDAFTKMGSARPELLKNKEALAMVTEKALILAEAAKMEMQPAIDAVAASMNQFNLDASQSERIINAIAAGSLEGSAEVGDLTESMKNVGTVAADSNMSLEQTVAALEVLGEKQLKGAEAGTKLRGALLKMKDAGVGYASGQFNLRDAIEEVNRKLSTQSSELEKDALKQKIFGIENITAGTILLQNVDKYDKLTIAVTGTDVAIQQAAKNTATNTALMAQAKNEFHNAAIELGKNLSPAMTAVYRAAGQIAGAFSKMIATSPAESLRLEGIRVNTLATELANSNTPLERRKIILGELKTIHPDIVTGLDAENLNYKTLTGNIQAYNAELSNRILLENLSEDEKKYATQSAKYKEQFADAQIEINKIISQTDTNLALSNASMEEKTAKTLEILKSKAAGFIMSVSGAVADGRNKEAIALLQLQGWIMRSTAMQNEMNEAQGKEIDFSKRVTELKKILGIEEKITAEAGGNPPGGTPPGGNPPGGNGSGSKLTDPFAPDAEKPIDMGWIKAMVDADAIKFAEKKRSEAEWTAFLDKEIDKQMAIGRRGLEMDKEIEQAREELKDMRIDSVGQIAGALSGMFEAGSAAAIAFFAIEKAVAIAQIWLNYAKESSAIAVTAAAMNAVSFGVAGTAWAAVMQPKALLRAGVNTGIVVAQAIGEAAGFLKGGPTGGSDKRKVAGVVHEDEYVIPAEGYNAPGIRPFVDLMEIARRNGSLARLDLRPVVQAMASGNGYSAGGSAGSSSGNSSSSSPVIVQSPGSGMSDAQLAKLNAILDRLDSKDFSIAIETYERKRENWNKTTKSGLK